MVTHQTNEAKAQAIGDDPAKLRARLNEAKAVLADSVRPLFKPGQFDFVRKRMVSNDGKVALQWRIRPRPNDPIDADNQQTSVGSVSLVSVLSPLAVQASYAVENPSARFGFYVNVYITPPQGTTLRNTIADGLTEAEAKRLSKLVNDFAAGLESFGDKIIDHPLSRA